MKIGVYVRVSTQLQDLDGQMHAIQQWLQRRDMDMSDVEFYKEQGISGKHEDRPEFQRLCADVESGRVKSVVVYALDRLSRKSTTAMQLLLDWMRADVAFYSVTQPMLQLGPDNPLRLTLCAIFADIAELERKAIIGRINSGLAAARKRGVKLGRRPTIDEAVQQRARELRAAGNTYARIADTLGISVHSAHTFCKERCR